MCYFRVRSLKVSYGFCWRRKYDYAYGNCRGRAVLRLEVVIKFYCTSLFILQFILYSQTLLLLFTYMQMAVSALFSLGKWESLTVESLSLIFSQFTRGRDGMEMVWITPSLWIIVCQYSWLLNGCCGLRVREIANISLNEEPTWRTQYRVSNGLSAFQFQSFQNNLHFIFLETASQYP